MNSKINGIVLKTRPLGDYDLILTIFSKELGKIEAVAKGARRSKNAPLYAQPFAYSDFSVFKGRSSLYSIDNSEVKEAFYNLRNDIVNLCLGQYFLEIVDFQTKSTITGDEQEILKLLLNSLFLLCQKEKTNSLIIKIVFELKYATLNGFGPDFERCINCGENPAVKWVFGKGVYCKKCKKDIGGAEINEAIQKIILHILNNEGISVYSFRTDDKLLEYLSEVTESYLGYVLDMEFKTLNYYKTISKE